MARSLSGASVTTTGGTDSSRAIVARHLLEPGVERLNISSRDEAEQDEMRPRMDEPRLKLILGDVRDREGVEHAFVGTDFIFHAAAVKQVRSCVFFTDQAVNTTAEGSRKVIAAAHKCGERSVVCRSMGKTVYPINAKGMSNALIEKTKLALGSEGFQA